MAGTSKQLVVDQRSVANLIRAVKRRKLTREQHELLEVLVSQLEQVEGTAGGLGTTVRYNLSVIDTQIRDVLDRTSGDSFDESAVAKLPDRMQERVLERLENVAERLETVTAKKRIGSYSTTAFKCLEDYERCKAAQSAAGYWCTIALLVCLAGKLGEAFVTGGKSKT